MEIGRSIQRVDAFDKVTGRARFTDDLCPRPILEARILHRSEERRVGKECRL